MEILKKYFPKTSMNKLRGQTVLVWHYALRKYTDSKAGLLVTAKNMILAN